MGYLKTPQLNKAGKGLRGGGDGMTKSCVTKVWNKILVDFGTIGVAPASTVDRAGLQGFLMHCLMLTFGVPFLGFTPVSLSASPSRPIRNG